MISNQALSKIKGLTGNFVYDDSSIVLKCYCNLASGDKFSTLEDKDGVNYQVPVGKKLIIDVVIANGLFANGTLAILGYADTNVGENASAPGTSRQARSSDYTYLSSSTSPYFIKQLSQSIPATKYPELNFNSGSTSGGSFIFIGRLV